MHNKAVTKYLARYAEPEAALNLSGRRYDYSLVIPAFNEDPKSVLNVWRQIKPGTSFLVILVVNSHVENDLSARMLVEGLTRHQKTTRLTDRAQLVENFSANTGPTLLIIDRFSRGYSIERKQGVGLARKIGMDIAASLINQGEVSANWLFTTDADAELPENYFDVALASIDVALASIDVAPASIDVAPASIDVAPASTDAAFIYPFKHFAEPALELPMLLYEISMLYYAAGLRWANSPYAYPTIGSTISCSVDRYASVRGFPKRNTGEDFYLLNKLRKTGEIKLGNGDPIVIKGRFSDRVPIGTGQAIKAIHNLHSPIAEFTVEHPSCFSTLKHFLNWLDAVSATQPERLATGDPGTDDYIQQIGLIPHYERKRHQSPTPKVMRKHLDDWFDGLKTRQFIHHFRDKHFGRVTTAGLGNAPFVSDIRAEEQAPDATLDTLEKLRASLRAFIYPQGAC